MLTYFWDESDTGGMLLQCRMMAIDLYFAGDRPGEGSTAEGVQKSCFP